MDNQIEDLRLDWIYDKLNLLKQDNVKNANILIIMDDCVSSIKAQQGDKRLQDLFFNRRHLVPKCPISIIITTQQFTMVPLKFRGVTDHICFLSMNPKDFDYLKKEIVFSQYRKFLPQLLEVYQQPHGFVFVRLNPFMICQNFKPLIAGSKYVGVATSFSAVSTNDVRKSVRLEESPAISTPNLTPKRLLPFSFKSL